MKKMFPFRFGAAGVARSASPTRSASAIARSLKRGRSLNRKFGEIFRPEPFAKLTTPSAALRWLRDFLLMPQPPLLTRRGIRLLEHAGQLLHTFIDRRYRSAPNYYLMPGMTEKTWPTCQHA